MATKKLAKKSERATAVQVSAHLQIGFLAVVGVSWLAQLVFVVPAYYYRGMGGVGIGTALSYLLYEVYPVLLFGIALLYTWKRYSVMLHRLFIAGLFAVMANITLSMTFYVLSILRARFDILIPDPSAESSTLLGVDGLILMMGVGLFVVVMGYLNARKKTK